MKTYSFIPLSIFQFILAFNLLNTKNNKLPSISLKLKLNKARKIFYIKQKIAFYKLEIKKIFQSFIFVNNE